MRDLKEEPVPRPSPLVSKQVVAYTKELSPCQQANKHRMYAYMQVDTSYKPLKNLFVRPNLQLVLRNLSHTISKSFV